MISKEVCESQIGRLEGLSYYPRDKPEAIRDLAAALKAAGNDAICVAVVNAWVEENSEAPKPADLRRLIWAENEKADEPPGKHKRCPLCGGGGWLTVWMLITYQGNSFIVRRREIIPNIRKQEDADKFCKKLGDGQTVLSGAIPCECLPDTHKAFMEHGAKHFPGTHDAIRRELAKL